jgi:hypothetical protein
VAVMGLGFVGAVMAGVLADAQHRARRTFGEAGQETPWPCGLLHLLTEPFYKVFREVSEILEPKTRKTKPPLPGAEWGVSWACPSGIYQTFAFRFRDLSPKLLCRI